MTNSKQCPKCKETIQGDAIKCKHCWADLRNWFKKHYIVTTLLWLVILWIIIWSIWWETSELSQNTSINNSSVQEREAETIIDITSTQLYTEYDANEIKADDMYKNQLLRVSWNIDSIWKDILDDIYVALEWDGYIFTVQCMLKWSEKTKASNLVEWDSITVVWKNTWKLWNIVLRNCIIE